MTNGKECLIKLDNHRDEHNLPHLIQSQLDDGRVLVALIIDEHKVIELLPEMQNVVLIDEVDVGT